MFERVAVVGAGVAGLAACWTAAQRGAQLRLLDGGAGASCLGSGAVDDRPWEQVARASEVLQLPPLAGTLPRSVRLFAEELGLWRLPHLGEPLVRLATNAGRVRVARGCDLGLLDLSLLSAGSRVILPRVARAEWDADSLALALSADAYCQSRRISFEAVDAKVLKLIGENRIAPAELASRHDDPARLDWLAQRFTELLERAGRVDAVLVGPWLGADLARSDWLSERLGVVVGEVLAGMGSPVGYRFEAARLRMLSALGVELEPYNVEAVSRRGEELELRVERDNDPVIVDAVVLAIGGLAAGGIVYDPPEQSAGRNIASLARCAFRLSLEAAVEMKAHGQPLDVGGSIHGPVLDDIAWPSDADSGLLESIGIACEQERIAEALFAAGDVIADRPRTMLQAAFSGIRAGAAAAAEPGAAARE